MIIYNEYVYNDMRGGRYEIMRLYIFEYQFVKLMKICQFYENISKKV